MTGDHDPKMNSPTTRDAPTGHKLFNFISTSLQPRRWAHIKRSTRMKLHFHSFLVWPCSLILLTSCGTISPDTKRVVASTETLHIFPVARSSIVKRLGLSSSDSQRFENSRGGRHFYSERWTLPDGSQVWAGDSEFLAPPTPITAKNIDIILTNPIRTSFETLSILSPMGKTLYSSPSMEQVVRQR